jgi:hypothetical protein
MTNRKGFEKQLGKDLTEIKNQLMKDPVKDKTIAQKEKIKLKRLRKEINKINIHRFTYLEFNFKIDTLFKEYFGDLDG